jgi:hypothetical protein
MGEFFSLVCDRVFIMYHEILNYLVRIFFVTQNKGKGRGVE